MDVGAEHTPHHSDVRVRHAMPRPANAPALLRSSACLPIRLPTAHPQQRAGG